MSNIIEQTSLAIELTLLEYLANGEILDYRIDVNEKDIFIMYITDSPFTEKTFRLTIGNSLNSRNPSSKTGN